jgi:hypothetical protein
MSACGCAGRRDQSSPVTLEEAREWHDRDTTRALKAGADLATARALLEKARDALDVSDEHSNSCSYWRSKSGGTCSCGSARSRALAAEIAEALR